MWGAEYLASEGTAVLKGKVHQVAMVSGGVRRGADECAGTRPLHAPGDSDHSEE